MDQKQIEKLVEAKASGILQAPVLPPDLEKGPED